ncbi:hypothetical protein J2853_008876 [Streptosporangium lutulentum]|uniref:Lipoprotein n=1 Tax=Streptosporangium lutulentum TaxID=1461250 RepID=A0ABT9QTC2_9ACTN|nr:hypothetical protein [Streptosporangium lutulentum]
MRKSVTVLSALIFCTTMTSCSVTVTVHVTGPLESVDLRELCIRSPNPSDDSARQCYPMRGNLLANLSAIKPGDLITLRVQDGIITSAEKVGPPTR